MFPSDTHCLELTFAFNVLVVCGDFNAKMTSIQPQENGIKCERRQHTVHVCTISLLYSLIYSLSHFTDLRTRTPHLCLSKKVVETRDTEGKTSGDHFSHNCLAQGIRHTKLLRFIRFVSVSSCSTTQHGLSPFENVCPANTPDMAILSSNNPPFSSDPSPWPFEPIKCALYYLHIHMHHIFSVIPTHAHTHARIHAQFARCDGKSGKSMTIAQKIALRGSQL